MSEETQSYQIGQAMAYKRECLIVTAEVSVPFSGGTKQICCDPVRRGLGIKHLNSIHLMHNDLLFLPLVKSMSEPQRKPSWLSPRGASS